MVDLSADILAEEDFDFAEMSGKSKRNSWLHEGSKHSHSMKNGGTINGNGIEEYGG